VLARRLLMRLGFNDAPLVAGPDRAPMWPAGAVGSISHAGGWCVAAVARAEDVRALGIDIELDTPLDEDAAELVLTPREQAWLTAAPPLERGSLAKRAFCAKEALYKCQYPLTGARLDFGDVELTVARDGSGFDARIANRRAVEAGMEMGGGLPACRRWLRAGRRVPRSARLRSRTRHTAPLEHDRLKRSLEADSPAETLPTALCARTCGERALAPCASHRSRNEG
jgi:hypothetical protein